MNNSGAPSQADLRNLRRLANAGDKLLRSDCKRKPKKRCAMCGLKRYIKVDGVCHSCWECL